MVTAEGVTSEWLTQALHQRGVDASVAAFRPEAVGTGQLGETRRFHLQYKGTPPPEAPQSVVGKFTSNNAVAAKTGKTMGFYRSEVMFYRSEVMFYREAAHRAGIRTPMTYAAELDPETNEFSLLFEDLAPAQQGDQMSGCTLVETRMALSEVSRLHAAFWNDTELMKQDWLYVPTGAQGYYTTALVEECWDYFKKTYEGWLPKPIEELCAKLVRNHAYWNRPRDFPKCYSHNDFRPDNMLFSKDGSRVAVVDWQTSNFLGSGMDVAYFLGGALPREVRRAHERQLLREYHDDLIKYGVTDYSFEHLMDDYRHYSFAVIIVAVTATMIVKRTERGDRLFMHMITGGAHQALDNDAMALLPG
ncbi:MAG: DUF1679 domain-containing protein [Nevskia sp.]|nr:DUF1679 domain-containing protein [Nevskia sp.]